MSSTFLLFPVALGESFANIHPQKRKVKLFFHFFGFSFLTGKTAPRRVWGEKTTCIQGDSGGAADGMRGADGDVKLSERGAVGGVMIGCGWCAFDCARRGRGCAVIGRGW